MTPGQRRGPGPVPLAACLLAVLPLSGCSLLGDGDRTAPQWAHDAQAERYYRPGVLSQGSELLQEHFPEVAEASPRAVVDGRFTDPTERAPIPAQDDHWWQAVVQLSPEQTEQLVADSAADQGDVGESEVLTLLVPPLEGELEECTGDWLSVLPALAREDGGTNITVAGDLIELAAVCESSGQLVTSARDM